MCKVLSISNLSYFFQPWMQRSCVGRALSVLGNLRHQPSCRNICLFMTKRTLAAQHLRIKRLKNDLLKKTEYLLRHSRSRALDVWGQSPRRLEWVLNLFRSIVSINCSNQKDSLNCQYIYHKVKELFILVKRVPCLESLFLLRTIADTLKVNMSVKLTLVLGNRYRNRLLLSF